MASRPATCVAERDHAPARARAAGAAVDETTVARPILQV